MGSPLYIWSLSYLFKLLLWSSAWCSVLPPANCRQSCLSDCWC